MPQHYPLTFFPLFITVTKVCARYKGRNSFLISIQKQRRLGIMGEWQH